jgi:KUP system potassium uptake protein
MLQCNTVATMANSLSDAPEGEATASGNGTHHVPATSFLALTIGSIGVVYGDIGTSPLYAFKEAIRAASLHEAGVSEIAVLGVLSLIFWSLIVIVTLKYVVILTYADNRGEGGTLALMALAQRALPKWTPLILVLGVIAAALFYGNAIITPALSVLSAVEGLEVAAPALDTWIFPIAVVVLVGLFALQSRGTARVAAIFGPITCLWFIAIAVPGLMAIIGDPAVLRALDPFLGVRFLANHGVIGLVTLGAVFLAVTGAEALYADLGHFGRRPIQAAWLAFVLPALVLNYLGQGALVLSHPETIENPFFLLYPDWARLPMVVLATAATVIASQAVITGAYSLSRQAIQLGLLPRLEIRHTSESTAGQIYMPRINAVLLLGVLLVIGLFHTSDALAGAYGIAVTGTMVVTAMLAFNVVWRVWNWSLLGAAALILPLLLIDVVFLGANLLKVASGGWFPLILGGLLILIMLTWRRGTRVLFEKTRRMEVPLMQLCSNLESHPPPRISGTAVFLTGDPQSTPTALLHSLKHFKVLHEHNVIATVVTVDAPRVDAADRMAIEPIRKSFTRLTLQYGFMETPDLSRAMAQARKAGLPLDPAQTSFFLSRRSLRVGAHTGMPVWQDKIYIALARNADDASNYFRIPTNRVIEIGTQVTI